MRIRAIVNPVAGTGDLRYRWPAIKSALEAAGTEISFTERKGHAEDLARSSAKDGVDCLVVVGGDGTLHEAVQGIALSETALLPVPTGTGSDFVRCLPNMSIDSALEIAKSGNFERIDLGLAIWQNGMRYFLNILEIGFGSVVMDYVNSHKRTKGSFNRGVLASLIKLRPYELTVESGEYSGNVSIIEMVIANGRYFGGGMLASPVSSLKDGFLDVHMVASMGRMSLISRFGSLRDGSYLSDARVRSFKTASLRICGHAPMEADGEIMGSSPVEIRALSEALKLISAKNPQ